ncbi:tRNA lysidine(34) synthetase TilS [Solirubrobacter sp. CPCC 204708]|uniref:tRNA(Ile)-lysidine synthase n=1 Tax=Solirubrobacter deserti TaxID=2282478 RepID=A0ABT4RPX7_9ACTN|nr:tRNA lysidine(34) synthetase TilS [Solirubrobacter deserti]MBE2318272.1 tRNA lysidine(34) synthetase TilS [Solirubrobacter deserti]MDA0140610.1 tRNA lysidine(34) synthetase TilS [Solirubrobacter deserti]
MTDVAARVAAGGLLAGPVVVLLSGGRDSVCLLDLAVRLAGPVVALHVNYGLREAAGADEAHCRALCSRLGVPLEVVRAGDPEGNVQAWAREVRYAAAERLEGAIAVGHTATDQAETVLYRLVASPGRRALLGMPARAGRVIRPLLELTRAETTAYCEVRGLPWREDASNAASARGRLREVLALHPAAEANVARTLAQLRDEAAVLDALIDVDADLTTLPPALARLTVQRIAEPAPVAEHIDAILALAARGGTGHVDLPGGLRVTVEYGRARVARREGAVAPSVRLGVPGRVAWGEGEVSCEVGAFAIADGTLDAAALAADLEVRPWRPGDRMRPLGLGGSKSLQDLFTDRKIPREERHRLPVVVSDGDIAWVPGVATGERFRARGDGPRVRLTWCLDSAADERRDRRDPRPGGRPPAQDQGDG